MNPTKALGPDGFPASYQKHWDSVSEMIWAVCYDIINHGGDNSNINHTYIALILKVNQPRMVRDYRPISLRNVIYKVISKTFANRLKPIPDQVIAPYQRAFIHNRLITDNMIIGYECLHKMRRDSKLWLLNLISAKPMIE